MNFKNIHIKPLCSYWFIIPLLLLVANDFIFKATFGNWFTGKLSDFSGLFIFGFFWIILFPKYKIQILLLIGIAFIYWKSVWSQGFIEFWNYYFFLNIDRTIDPTDLTALIALALAKYVEKHKYNLRIIQVNPVIPFALSSFAFMATSYYSEIKFENTYKFNFDKETLMSKLDSIPDVSYYTSYRIIDSVHHTTEIKTKPILKYERDTIFIAIKENFCFERFEAVVVITENNNQSKIKTIRFDHRCPTSENGKDDLSILKASFLKKVIDPLLNSK